MAYQDSIENAVNLRLKWFDAMDQMKGKEATHKALEEYRNAKMRIVSWSGKSSDRVDADIMKCYRERMNGCES